jgi:prepilin-type N-terminal cleavage/methylation domain-containing protein
MIESFKKHSHAAGFTLIELLVTVLIIGIVLTTGLVNYQRINRRQIFTQAVQTVLKDLRFVQDKTLSAEKPAICLTPTPITPEGYPLLRHEFEFTSNQDYVFRAVCDNAAGGEWTALVKSQSLPGTVVKTGGPDLVSFQTLYQGVDLGGAQQEILTFSGYGLTDQIVINDAGMIYQGQVPTATPTP